MQRIIGHYAARTFVWLYSTASRVDDDWDAVERNETAWPECQHILPDQRR
jgi:hypothetical protein